MEQLEKQLQGIRRFLRSYRDGHITAVEALICIDLAAYDELGQVVFGIDFLNKLWRDGHRFDKRIRGCYA